jgi:hypothetical protein
VAEAVGAGAVGAGAVGAGAVGALLGKQDGFAGRRLKTPLAVDTTNSNIPGITPSTSATNSGFPSPRNSTNDFTTNSVFSFPERSVRELTFSARLTEAFITDLIPTGVSLKNSSRYVFILI